MSKSILITRPHHDLITKYFHAWSQKVIDLAKKKNLNVYDLHGKNSNKKNFLSYTKKLKPSLIFLNGHGNPDVITGDKNEVLVESSTVLDDSIIYGRSCDAGLRLGYYLVKNGTRSFIGYNRKFFCGYTPDKITRPLDDKIASIFLEPSNLVVSTLLKNNTTGEAHERSKQVMYKSFRRMLSSNASFEEKYSARWVWSNLSSQILIGDNSAKI